MIDAALAFAIRLERGAASRLRNTLYRGLGVQLDGYVWLRRVSIPRNWRDIAIGAHAALDDGVVLLATGATPTRRIAVGQGTYINRNTMIDASESIRIGAACMIGPYCYITDHDHGTRPGQLVSHQPLVSAPVTIGDNVWLGAGVIVLKGVTIGNDAVVGAGAVVTKDVAAGAKVAGVPARPLARVAASEGHV